MERRIGGGSAPKVLTLLSVIDDHRGALEYDWRSRFNLPLTSVPSEVGWDEAWRLYTRLSADPSSHISAAQNDFDYPFSREAMILADFFDLTYAINAPEKGPRPKPYPRPWPDADKEKKRLGKTSLPSETVRALLARRGPAASAPSPVKERPRDARGRFAKES